MARKPLVTTQEPTPEIELRSDATDAANLMAVVQTSYDDERDLLNQLLGQAQMAEAFAKFSVTVTTSKLAFVKENKLYRALGGKKTGDGHQLSGTWEEFCSLLGRSREQIDEDIRNLKAIGEQALESMSRMGIGYREFRQFRRLPDDQKTALIEVAKSGDKDAFLELAEDMIAKHAREKEALALRVEEAEANLEARSQRLEEKEQQINKLNDEVTRIKKRVKSLPPVDVAEEIRKEVTMMTGQAEVGIRAMRAGLLALVEHAVEHNIPHDDFMSGLICQLEQALRELRSEFDVKSIPDGDSTPEWLRPGAADAANARIEADMVAAGWTRDAAGRMVPPNAQAD